MPICAHALGDLRAVVAVKDVRGAPNAGQARQVRPVWEHNADFTHEKQDRPYVGVYTAATQAQALDAQA